MVSDKQAKGFWNELFCRYYGKIRPIEWDQTICWDCEKKKNCLRKYLRKLLRLVKQYGNISRIPIGELER